MSKGVQWSFGNRQVDAMWRNLTHSLSGLLCASLNFLESSATTATPPKSFFHPDQETCADKKNTCSPENPTGCRKNEENWADEVEERENEGRSRQNLSPEDFVRYGALPREAVCTENLTPWLKLLPCRDKAGLATLFHRPTIYGANYHSMRMHISTNGVGLNDESVEITLLQTLTLVLEPKVEVRGERGKSGGRPGEGGRTPKLLPDWSISSLFEREISGPCPLANESRVYVELERNLLEATLQTKEVGVEGERGVEELRKVMEEEDWQGLAKLGETFKIIPNSEEILHEFLITEDDIEEKMGKTGSVLVLFDVWKVRSEQKTASVKGSEKIALLDVKMVWRKPLQWVPRAVPFSVQRFITGYGNERGGITVKLQANGEIDKKMGKSAEINEGNFFDLLGDEEQGWREFQEEHLQQSKLKKECSSHGNRDAESRTVSVFQVIPWFIRLYFHTLEVRFDGHRVALWEVATRAHAELAEDRKKPTLLDLDLKIPVNVTCVTLSVEFDKGYLYVDEHPSDASRGMDLPSAIVQVLPTVSMRTIWSTNENLTSVTRSPLLQSMQTWKPLRVYTEILVVPLPLPDFSMPYNTITLTCTVLAMFFGSILNTLRRRPGEEERKTAMAAMKGGESVEEVGGPVGRISRKLRKIPKLVKVLFLFIVAVAIFYFSGLLDA